MRVEVVQHNPNHLGSARVVVIAIDSMGRGQRVKGEDELLGRGVCYCAICDRAFFRDHEVVGSTDEMEDTRQGFIQVAFRSKLTVTQAES